MGKEVIFLEGSEEIAVSKMVTPEFYQLYQQSVLLALKEQGVLNEGQYRYCLDAIKHQI